MNSEKGWKLAEFNKMSDERLESLAGAYSKNVIREFENSKVPLVYEVMAILQKIDNNSL